MTYNPKTQYDKIDIVTPALRKKMMLDIFAQIKKFPKRNVSEDLPTYMERKMVLPSGTSARPGPYRFANAPFWREVAYEMSESSKTTEGVVMAATQTGKTVVMMGHEQYCIEYGIGPVNYTSSDEGLAEKHSETRFGPMLQAAGMNDYIQAPVKSGANKSTGNKVNLKFYKGTFIQFIGARSESKASSTPIRILHIDEIDKFPLQLSGGGNMVVKLLRRTDSYGNLKKIFYVSTPKRKATSQIEPLYEQGDMRKYHVECQNPECGKLHLLSWSNTKWDKDENGRVLLEYSDDDNMINDPVWHECPHCGYKMKCHEKVLAMKEEGHGGHAKWIASKKPDRPGIKSWHVPGLYGFRSWLDIVLEFQDAVLDIVLLEDWTCDTMAETWADTIDKPDRHFLMSRIEHDWLLGQIPDGVKQLSLGCDVQDKYIEWTLMGYGRRLEGWVIQHDVFAGDPHNSNDPLWDKLEEILTARYETLDGRNLSVNMALVDAPYANTSVMAFCERFPYHKNMINTVYPSFGKYNPSAIVKDHESTIATPELLIDDQKLKRFIYNSLRRKVPSEGHSFPRGFIHFPEGLTAPYFEQLTNESVIEIVNKRGDSTFEIHNTPRRRNEPLDTMKMALAGIYYSYWKYFKMINDSKKQRKKKEISPDWPYYWNIIENGK